MATPVVDDITCQRLGEQIKGGREFTTLRVDQGLSVVAAAFGEAQLDQKLDPQIADMIYGSHEPSRERRFALAGGAHDGAGRPSVARLGCALFDEARITEPIERSIHERPVNRKNSSEVRARLEFTSHSETVCCRLADKS